MDVGILLKPSASEKPAGKPKAGHGEDVVDPGGSPGPAALGAHISLGSVGSRGLASVVAGHMLVGKAPTRPPKLRPLGSGSSGENGHCLPVVVLETSGSWLVALRGPRPALAEPLVPWAPARRVKRRRRRRKLPCWNMSWQSGSRVQ
jgi:hypothetical protein